MVNLPQSKEEGMIAGGWQQASPLWKDVTGIIILKSYCFIPCPHNKQQGFWYNQSKPPVMILRLRDQGYCKNK